ncbi:hypothetical protein A1A1_08109 [Planococcus antarcticus DSM 14505]|uniref:Uncharacterized protein n=1 Tax=Planococcus antarcticus DSM 14505 TaxID=1185653 RepID=A0A1C7DHC7_9BACL|nr:hypothetical protein [Planococcus antarcticus]ANU10960.1 hypothetical protein BBH88_11900 [Planococcus antarcticus DSM 14505]EIM07120.1 hypothetical protein A1A1_08109 [Planococcus antarcticus DSM 14505]
MYKKCFSWISAGLLLLTMLPLTLAAIHWFHKPLELLLVFHLHFPCVLSGLGVVAALIGAKGDIKFNLVLFNLLTLCLYLIFSTGLHFL